MYNDVDCLCACVVAGDGARERVYSYGLILIRS